VPLDPYSEINTQQGSNFRRSDVLIEQLFSTQRIARTFLADDDGVTAIEYGLLAALIAIACIGSFQLTGASLGAMYDMWSAAVAAAL
jgi:pilus assembly protein Flp/PilA